ncbi:DUF1877 family protein [Corallococcus macrosporus]|uniref:DUF1877 family protein n=1 Tax=Corallococcus macrosporus TaxID=35 RepID=A0ABS3DM56_9BACT|nr:DUF1877 family protein [Corallococcus macrosporus]MBN8232424.1 DUF1877 family protein [Corallococcus macrosporus]
MGFDMTYQAVPASSVLLEVARTDVAVGSILFMAIRMFGDPKLELREASRRMPMEPDERTLWELVLELRRVRPDLRTLNLFLARDWDLLHFFLSAHRRDEPGTEADTLADMAILGEAIIAEHVLSGQDVPLRYTRPETVERIARMLQELPFESVWRHCPPVGESPDIYKHSGIEPTEEVRSFVEGLFKKLRAFYVSVAAHGDGVLVERS